MALAGTIVDGQVQLDSLPDVNRVDPLPQDEDDSPIPLPTETYAQHLAVLRESIEENSAGRTRPIREILKEIAGRQGLPLEPGE